jgi:leucyl aminopeptidase (aminopeptidase T)
MAETLALEARRAGVRPVLLEEPDRLFEATAASVRPSDAFRLSQPELAAARASDGYIMVHAGLADFERYNRLGPAHLQEYTQRQAEWRAALARSRVPSVYLLSAEISAEGARAFGVELEAWRRESLRSSLLPASVFQRAARPLARRLRRGKRLTILHPNGTHLVLGLAGREPVLDDGVVDAHDLALGRPGTTVPGGFLSVAVDERVAEGRFVANRPSRTRWGAIRDFDWTFHGGRLVRSEAGAGREFFDAYYPRAGRERDRPGVFVIGVNPEIHDFPFTEDQEDGVLTLEIGHNDDFGGRTRGKFRAFAILRGADLFVDEVQVLKAGRRRR